MAELWLATGHALMDLLLMVTVYYSPTLLYRHLLNTGTHIQWTVSFIPTKESLCIFSKINLINTDAMACPVGVRINRVPLY